jgi:hypothetical protein
MSAFGAKKFRANPRLSTYGRAKMAAIALQKIHFSNGCFWRKADIASPDVPLMVALRAQR